MRLHWKSDKTSEQIQKMDSQESVRRSVGGCQSQYMNEKTVDGRKCKTTLKDRKGQLKKITEEQEQRTEDRNMAGICSNKRANVQTAKLKG